MNVSRPLVSLVVALLMATTAIAGQVDLPSGKGTMLITLDDGSEVRVASYDTIHVTSKTIATEHGRTELRGDVRIKVMRNGSEVMTINAASAVVTRVAPEIAR